RVWLLPISLDRVPAIAEALLVSVAVLRNDGSDSLRMGQRQTQADGSSVIEDVNGEAFEPNRLGETIDDLGEVFEGVAEVFAIGGLRESEAWQIRRDHAIAVGQGGNEIAKHV